MGRDDRYREDGTIPLQDPRRSSRWGGEGAAGRFYPGKQAPLPTGRGAPTREEMGLPWDYEFGDVDVVRDKPERTRRDSGYRQTEPGRKPYRPQFPASSLPEDDPLFAQYQAAPEDPTDYLAGWDYQNPPMDAEGQPVNHNFESLPVHAKGWTPFGEPYYGEGWEGWTNKIKSYWNSTADKEAYPADKLPQWDAQLMSGDIPEEDLRAWMDEFGVTEKGIQDDFWGTMINVGKIGLGKAFETGATGVTNMFASADDSFLRPVSKTLGTGLYVVMDGFQAITEGYERGLGFVAMNLEDLGEGSSIQPVPELPAWVPEWARWMKDAAPTTMMWNGLRAVTAPPKDWTQPEAQAMFERNWQASRIAYSVWGNETVKAEYVRRLEDGENPDLLAMELMNPASEMVGQMVLDPLNFLGLLTKPLQASRRITNAADELVTVTKVFDDLIGGADALSDANAAELLPKLVTAQLLQNGKTANNLDDFATASGMLAYATNTKRFHVTRRMGDMLTWARNVVDSTGGQTEDLLDVFRALILRSSDNVDEVGEGIDALLKFPAPKPWFSRGGHETGLVLRRMLENSDGVLDWDGFLKGLAKAQDGGIDEMLAFAGKKIAKGVDAQFPTYLDMAGAAKRLDAVEAGTETLKQGERLVDLQRSAKFGETTTAVGTFLARFDKRVKNKLYSPINQIFAGMYMGMSPGYAFRNMLSNSVHVFVDMGPGAWGKGTLTNAEKWRSHVVKWAGGKPPSGFDLGLGAHAAEVGKTTGKWYEKFSALSEKFEQGAAARIVGKTYTDTMFKMLASGRRALPDVKPLIDAGLDQKATNVLFSLVLENYGDVKKSVNQFRQLVKKGDVQLVRTTAWMTKEQIEIAHKYGVLDEFTAALKFDGSMDDVLREVRGLSKPLSDEAAQVVTEHAGFMDDSPHFEEMATVGNANDAGHMSDEAAALSGNRFAANGAVFGEYRYAVQKIEGQALALLDKDTAALDALRQQYGIIAQGGYFDKINDMSRKFTRDIWSNNDSIKAAKTAPPGGWAQEWENIGLTKALGSPPPGLTKKQLLDTLWDGYWEPQKKAFWSGARDVNAAYLESYVKQIGALVPDLETDKIMDSARITLQKAQTLDDAEIIGDRMYSLTQILQTNMQKGDNAGSIRALATKYGLGSLSAKGTPYDGHILNAINKYSRKTFDSLDNVTVEQAWRALEARNRSKDIPGLISDLGNVLPPGLSGDRLANKISTFAEMASVPRSQLHPELSEMVAAEAIEMLDELTSAIGPITMESGEIVIRASDNPKWYVDVYGEGLKSKTTLTNALQRVIEGKDTTQMKYVTRLKEIMQERLIQKADVFDDVALAIKGDFRHVDEVGDITKPADLVLPTIELKPLVPPPTQGGLMTMPRMANESLPGFQKFLGELEQGVKQNWGKLVPASLGDEAENALTAWEKVGIERVSEARLLAGQVSNEARKFALHDYQDKRIVDLALSYVFPYNFWYSRTYKNWLTRIATNPGLVGAYSAYKTGLSRIHAGAPDWWKYQVNTNELFGLDHENPLFFNLEATLNPLNGLTGVDFSDPNRRVDWWTRTLDDMQKIGPSVWTPLSIATAFALQAQGEDEAASRWGSRLIPQTAALRSIAALAGINMPDIDPNIYWFSDGQGPYERRRVGRALGAMVEEGALSIEQAIDAAHAREGDTWELATHHAVKGRAWGQLAGFFAGVGFKARSASDQQIDQFYNSYYRLWEQSDTLTPDEFKAAMDGMRQQYPWMDAVLLSRKGGPARDRALAYNVMGRLAPGGKSDMLAMLGIDESLMDKFYDDKGDMGTWAQTDIDRFMAGIVDLSTLFEMPDDATAAEWNAARRVYGNMQFEAVQLFGDDIWHKVDMYFASKGDDEASKQLGEQILASNPEVQAVLDWKEQQIMGDDFLMKYYGGLDFIERYYTGEFYSALEAELGDDIWDKWDEYYRLKEQDELNDSLGDKTKLAKEYWDANPQLEGYGNFKDRWQSVYDERARVVGDALEPGLPPILRGDLEDPSVFQEEALEQLDPQEQIPWEQWQQVLSPAMQRLVEDFYLSGELLPDIAREDLEELAEQLGMSEEQLYNSLQGALLGAGEPVP